MKDDMITQTLEQLRLGVDKAYKNRVEARRLLHEAQTKWVSAMLENEVQIKAAQVVANRGREDQEAAHTTRKPFRKFETVPESGAFTRHVNEEGAVLYVSVYYRNAGNSGGAYQLVGVFKDLTGNIDNIRSANELLYVLGHLEYLRKLTGYRLNASLDADKIEAIKDFRNGSMHSVSDNFRLQIEQA